MLENSIVLVASAPEAYGSTPALLSAIAAYIASYADLPDFWAELLSYYCLMTWVYDAFTALPYIRFIGEPGTGKTRMLQTVTSICYNAITAGGSTTSAPIFRMLETWRGTMAVDEADFRESDLWSDIIKILNQGYMAGVPVLRASSNGHGKIGTEVFRVYGPKILSTRKPFDDMALETRCITLGTREGKISPRIPRQLPPRFFSDAQKIRNMCLRWRFDNRGRFAIYDESMIHDLDPRAGQILMPLLSIHADDGFRDRLLKFMKIQAEQDKLIKPICLVTESLRRMRAADSTPGPFRSYSIRDLTHTANVVGVERDANTFLHIRTVTQLVRSLNLNVRRSSSSGANVAIIHDETLQKILAGL